MQFNLFPEKNCLKKLSQLGDPLEKLGVIDFELFRAKLDKALLKERRNNAGRPAFDRIMMFKILILQRLFNISDDQTEFLITDRMSFQRFLGLALGSPVPDAKTIWYFREQLTKNGVIDELFKDFNRLVESQGLIARQGSIIDATFIDAPKQRNKPGENQAVKEGKTPEEWKEKPHKLAQKDVDARWTKKGDERHFGYKNHVKVDSKSKMILDYRTTAASVHDSNCFGELLDKDDRVIYADSGYVGKEIPAHIKNEVCERRYRGKPLSEKQKAENCRKSKIRCRIEHVFGFMTVAMRGITVRSIGIRRAEFVNGLTNLVYNMFRFAFLRRKCFSAG